VKDIEHFIRRPFAGKTEKNCAGSKTSHFWLNHYYKVCTQFWINI